MPPKETMGKKGSKNKGTADSTAAAGGSQATEPSHIPTPTEVRNRHLAIIAAEAQESTFDRTRFNSILSEQRYQMAFTKRGVAVERPIDPESFKGEPFVWTGEFERRGWKNLAKFSGNAVITLCREFMANIHKAVDTPGQERLESWVRGVPVVLTPDTFVHHYGISRVPNAQFTWPGVGPELLEEVCNEVLKPGAPRPGDTQIKKKYLKERYLPMFIWSCHNLLPLSRIVELSLMRLQLLWAVGTGRSIDLPRYMFMHLFTLYSSPSPLGSIPHGCLLTKLFKASKVKIPSSTLQEKSKGKITLKTISRSKAQYARNPPPVQGDGVVMTKEVWEAHVKECREFETGILERMTRVEAVQKEQLTIMHRHTALMEEILEAVSGSKKNEENEEDDEDDASDTEED